MEVIPIMVYHYNTQFSRWDGLQPGNPNQLWDSCKDRPPSSQASFKHYESSAKYTDIVMIVY